MADHPGGRDYWPTALGTADRVFSTISDLGRDTGSGDLQISFSELAENEAELAKTPLRPGIDATAGATPPARPAAVGVTTLIGLAANGPAEVAAKGYVMAQEFAFRGNSNRAAEALLQAESGDYGFGSFHQRRLHAIRNYATNAGVFGPAAKEAMLNANATRSAIGWVVFILGIAVGVAGPFADIIASRIGRRAGRIEEAQQKLDAQRAAREPTAIPGAFGRLSVGTGIESIAAMDGDAIMAAISRRLQLYWIVAIAAGGAAALALAGHFLFRLPDAASNTAFGNVALYGDLARWARARVSPCPTPP